MILAVVFIILIILGIGLPVLLVIVPKSNFFIKVGFSFPIGIGIFTLMMFLSNLLGFRFSLLNEFLLFLLLSIPLIFIAEKRIKDFYIDSVRMFRHSNLSQFELTMLGILAFLTVTSFVNTFYWPVHIWDSLVLYDFRGHVFASTGLMSPAFIDGYYYSYPLLTSLAHTIVYLAGGKYPQFLYSLFYLSLGLGFYGLLREFVSRKTSMLFTTLLLSTGLIFYHSLLSLTNLPYSVYLSLGAICIYLWDKKKEKGYLILSALLVGLSTWTRSTEPFWMAILFVVFIVSIYRRKIWNIAVYSLVFFPIREVWKVFQNSLMGKVASTAGGVSYAKFLAASFDFPQWGQIIIYLFKNVVMPWGAIFVVYILVTISLFVLKTQKKFFLIFFITYALLAVLIVGTFGLSLIEEDWYRIGDAAQRLSMLFYPLFVYCIALVL
ncbi:MAG: hypothetical protein ABSC49_02065 [Candidatus Microgenomates bacterium]|jgi:hypothetical protein